ncbi:hypothetical protein ACLKA7_014196 [Drosophila subpalustris]
MNSSIGVTYRVFTLLKPKQSWMKQHFKHYAKKLYERGKASENTHFLKIQYDQLIKLKNKILKQRSKLNKEIEELEDKMSEVKSRQRKH